MFSVIQVIQYYDDIEGVKCLASFNTEQEAEDYLASVKDRVDSVRKARLDYINKFVDDMVLPDTDYNGWVEFLKQFHPFGVHYVLPKDFKKSFAGYLWKYVPNNIAGFEPPAMEEWFPLFVVKIKLV